MSQNEDPFSTTRSTHAAFQLWCYSCAGPDAVGSRAMDGVLQTASQIGISSLIDLLRDDQCC